MRFSSTLPLMANRQTKPDSLIGAKMRLLRESRGLTQGDVAASIGRHQSRVAKWELGQGNPYPADILRLADLFEVSLRFLCDDSDTEPHQAEDTVSGVTDMNDDEKFLMALAKKVGARTIVDHYLGISEPAKTEDSPGSPRIAKAVATHVRPMKGDDFVK